MREYPHTFPVYKHNTTSFKIFQNNKLKKDVYTKTYEDMSWIFAIRDSQKLKPSQMPINEWTDKQNVVLATEWATIL